ncbi:MAG: hypothetical protein CVV64_08960 [Candidatus Wallbacteria bacterium HGW-Wallbacteria-1]|jgi:hypothetical protein|uniref:Uncharacterized protein n=1 Tax=Candidatus Wallbacteria bacterium HGW-Wallbacteria-1 TaxID=2013854 RepID=A0A2N1PQ63_9BACT|nr:MAG: hypothetical protein CVV64_08960 [Candidatus Wallbacteria bacterium HGW-Wallbacteria-1]
MKESCSRIFHRNCFFPLLLIAVAIAGSGCLETDWHMANRPVTMSDSFWVSTIDAEGIGHDYNYVSAFDRQKCYDDSDVRLQSNSTYYDSFYGDGIADPVKVSDGIVSLSSKGWLYWTNWSFSMKRNSSMYDSYRDYENDWLETSKKYFFSATPAFSSDFSYVFAGAYRNWSSPNKGFLIRMGLDFSDFGDEDSRDAIHFSDSKMTVRADLKVAGQWLYAAVGAYLYRINVDTFTKIDSTPLELLQANSSNDSLRPPTNLAWRLGPFKRDFQGFDNILIKVSGGFWTPQRSITPAQRPQLLSQFLIDSGAGNNYISSSPVITENNIILTTQSHIICLEPGGLFVRWARRLVAGLPTAWNRMRTTVTVDRPSNLIYSAEGANIVCRSLVNGSQLWQTPTNAAVHSAPFLVPGGSVLLTGDQNGNGYAISTRSGFLSRSENFNDGGIFATPEYDSNRDMGIFFTYGDDRGGFHWMDATPGVVVRLPIALEALGGISYNMDPYYGTITTVAAFSMNYDGTDVVFEKKIKDGSSVNYTMTVSPNPTGGSGIIATFNDTTPEDSSDAAGALRFTANYPPGTYQLNLSASYVNPDDSPAVWTLSINYVITVPVIPGAGIAFRNGSPPLDFQVVSVSDQTGASFVDEDIPVSAQSVCHHVRRDIPWATPGKGGEIVGWSRNINYGKNVADSYCGIVPSPDSKVRIIYSFSRGTPVERQDEIAFPPDGATHNSGSTIYNVPTIPSDEDWGDPTYAVNGVFTDLQYWVMLYSSRVVAHQLVHTGSHVEEKPNGETEEVQDYADEWKWEIIDAGRTWTSRDPSAYPPFMVGVKDRTPPIISGFPRVLNAMTGDLCQFPGIFYSDNNMLDEAPWKFKLYIEQSNHGISSISHAGWVEIEGFTPAKLPGYTPHDSKELRMMANPSDPNSALSVPQGPIPSIFWGNDILRYYVTIEDSSGNVNPGCRLILDNNNPGNHYAEAPWPFNPRIMEDPDLVGFISVSDNDKPDIFLTVEPKSDANLIAQSFDKIEYRLITTPLGESRWSMHRTDLVTGTTITEQGLLTANGGSDSVWPNLPGNVPYYLKATGMSDFGTFCDPDATEIFTDRLYYAFPEDTKVNFYIRYEDNVKYRDRDRVESVINEALVKFNIIDPQDDRSPMEAGPYSFNDSTWNITTYDDGNDLTTNDIFRSFVFRSYNVAPDNTINVRPPIIPGQEIAVELCARDFSGNGRQLTVHLPILKTLIDIHVLEQKLKSSKE